MNAETQTFLQTLFARCPAATPAPFITLSAIHPDGDKPTPSRHVPLGNMNALERAVEKLMEANERGWGAYVGVATRQRGLGRWSRGGKRDLGMLPALFVDIDDPEDALLRLGWFDLPASMILHSGRGYHAFWLLETPTTDFATADQAIHGLAQHLGGDEVLSIAQSMRLVGTINTKPGRENALCTFVGYHPNRLYDLNEFRQFIPIDTVDHHPLHGHALPTSIEHQHQINDLTDAVIHMLDGRYRSNGFIAARCPLPHLRDRPGAHFSYSPDTGWGFCFGKHGKLSPNEMCNLLGVPVTTDHTEFAA
jgi:hypothetical protein